MEKLPRVCEMSGHPAVDKSRPKCLLSPHPTNRTASAWHCDFFISKYQSRVYIISFKYRSGNINNVVSELLKQLKGLTRIDVELISNRVFVFSLLRGNRITLFFFFDSRICQKHLQSELRAIAKFFK